MITWIKSQYVNSFTKEENILEHFRHNILVKKISVVSNVSIAAIFTQHFVHNCSQLVILGRVYYRLDWYVNKCIGILCPVIRKSKSSGVESSPCNPGVQILEQTILIVNITWNESFFLRKLSILSLKCYYLSLS